MFFFGVQKSLWDTKRPKGFLWDTKVFFVGYKRLFFGIQNLFLTFSEVKGVSSIVKLFLTFWKVKAARVGVQRSATHKAAPKAGQSSSTNNTKNSTNILGQGCVFQRTVTPKAEVKAALSQQQKQQKAAAETTVQASETKKSCKKKHKQPNPHKQQQVVQTAAQTAPNSSNTGKNTKRITERSTESSNGSSTNSSKSSTNSTKSRTNSSTSSSKETRKEERGPNREKVEDPRGGSPKFLAFFFLLPPEISLSVLSLRLFTWKFGGV